MKALAIGIVAALGVMLTGCGDLASSADGAITVSAAASLTSAFGTIKDQFIAANPGADVTINFGSSGTLETQIESGAPADVAAFADTATMQKLADLDLLAGAAQEFVTNRLIIVTKPGNPAGIASLADLATGGVVSLCAATAPCGEYADQILATAAVTIPESSVTRGQDVKATLAAVTEGDAVAAIVYVTDALVAGASVDSIEIADDQNAIATYTIAVVKAAENDDLAQAFVDYVVGPEGRAVLATAGFGAA